MNQAILSIYHRLPYHLKCSLASLYGMKLKKWRYGRSTDQWIQEALLREQWSDEQWQSWKQANLEAVLSFAAQKTPYYRKFWENKPGESWRELKKWPILSKEEVRKNPKDFLVDDLNTAKMFQEHTSGTTGTPLNLWCSRQTLQQWYALSQARWKTWYGISANDRWAILGGRPIVAFKHEKPPFWIWNASLNQLYLSAFHLRKDFLKYYLKALADHSIVYLYGYSSGLYLLALEAMNSSIRLKLKVVVTNAEPLFDWQRQIISKGFNCPVRETYGQAEMLAAASECEFGKMHFWSETGICEVLNDQNETVRQGESGRLVVTGLLNKDMPLIRYDLLDKAVLEDEKTLCSCGRNLPVIKKILGRFDDMLLTKDGRRIMQVDTIFSSDLPLREAQIIQESIDDITVKVVPDHGWCPSHVNKIEKRLKECMGDINVKVEIVERIPRTWAGKFRIIQSKLTQKAVA